MRNSIGFGRYTTLNETSARLDLPTGTQSRDDANFVESVAFNRKNDNRSSIFISEEGKHFDGEKLQNLLIENQFDFQAVSE